MSRHIVAYGASVTLLALLCIAALIRLESSLGAEPFRYFQLGDATRGSIGTQVMLQRQVRQQANKLRGSNNAKSSVSQSRQYVDDELMTPWLIARIEKQEKSDWLAPMHVHLLWIGDLKKAPKDRLKYPEMGYTLKVHTSAEEILDGFHPYVLQAYRKAVPAVVGYDFLKLAMLYKYGGLSVDADTSPTLSASELEFPEDCDIVLGKERHLHYFEKPKYRESGPNTYGYSRPFQVLNWAMAVSKPRNPHIKWMLKMAMMHFFGLRDMERAFIQDIAGSGLITDYVALLHEKEGRHFANVYEAKEYISVEGVCVSDHYFKGKWIHHSSLGSWKKNGGAGGAQTTTGPDTGPLAPRVSSDTIDSLWSSLAPDSEADSFIHLPPATRPHTPSRSVCPSDLHLPQAVTDEELDLAKVTPRNSTVLPPLVFPDDKKKNKVQWEATPRMQDEVPVPPVSSARLLASPESVRSMCQKKSSLNEFHLSTPALMATIDVEGDDQSAEIGVLSSPRLIHQKTFVLGARRATVSANSVSHHALERLGVNADILKKEKGMKKLGICDVDIERSEELRRYTGIATKKMGRNKAELVFGFTDEQLQRVKAIKRLGTSEQEIFDDYCRRISMLGTHERPMTSF